MKKLLLNIWSWVVLWLWQKSTEKPERTPPIKIKAVEVAHAYMVLQYHGQRINILKTEYAFWKAMGRKDKRAMAKRFEVQEKKGLIKFVEVEGNLICVKNRNYEGSKNTD
jgi:hypothetical protein